MNDAVAFIINETYSSSKLSKISNPKTRRIETPPLGITYTETLHARDASSILKLVHQQYFVNNRPIPIAPPDIEKEIIDYCQQQDNIEHDAIEALIGTSVKRLDTCHVAAQCLTFTTNIFHENMVKFTEKKARNVDNTVRQKKLHDPNISDDTKDLELRPNKCEVTHNFNLSSHSSSIKPKRLHPAPAPTDDGLPGSRTFKQFILINYFYIFVFVH
ncbi:hypothetical protein RhiirA4_478494 [Rhizophagus irregularis]|uniref:Uncharacterized protein n=1 Tax=Rhizophagus irregularis TaxID=588596 RepID=A0A2I1HF10_9GLOM|nr:hypothetical protein RhiirA4_478494 [Rhizophagus irregularis]